MADTDIERVRKILRYRGRSNLVDLLQNSTSRVDESSNYGNYWYSLISTFEIYSPIEKNERLKDLSEDDQRAIFDAVLEIYPPKEHAPEIVGVQFYLDPDIESESTVISCQQLREIGFEYVGEQIGKCREKIQKSDYDGAITNARTLVETVCLFIFSRSQRH